MKILMATSEFSPFANTGQLGNEVQILASELKKLGAKNIHTEPVPVRAWQEGPPSRLELISPRQHAYDSLHCVHSAAATLNSK